MVVTRSQSGETGAESRSSTTLTSGSGETSSGQSASGSQGTAGVSSVPTGTNEPAALGSHMDPEPPQSRHVKDMAALVPPSVPRDPAGILGVATVPPESPTPPPGRALRRTPVPSAAGKSRKSSKRGKDLARARFELAAAKLAMLEAESDTDGESASDIVSVRSRVDEWVRASDTTLVEGAMHPYQPPPVLRHILTQVPPVVDVSHKDVTATTTGQAKERQPDQAVPDASTDYLTAPPVSTDPVPLTGTVDTTGAPKDPLEEHQHKAKCTKYSPNRDLVDNIIPPLKPHFDNKDKVVEPQARSDIAELAAAIAQMARAGGAPGKPPKYLSDLPTFDGRPSEWLQFKATYVETAQHFTTAENNARLRRALKGTAKEAVECLFLGPSDPDLVLNRLESRFGRPEALIVAEIEKLKHITKLSDNPRDICAFASKIANVVATINALGRPHYLHSPEICVIIEDKLTPIVRSRWYDYELTTLESEPGLIKLSRFLDNEADRNARHAKPEITTLPERSTPPVASKRPHPRSYATAGASENARTGRSEKARSTAGQVDVTCPVCQGKTHKLSECTKFISSTINDRWELAKNHRLCFRCLKRRSWKHRCRDVVCGVGGCEMYHHSLLHYDRVANNNSQATVTNTWAPPRQSYAYLKILPVCVSGPKGSFNTYALLDDGSTVTLLTSDTARKIGAEGPVQPFYIEAVAGARVDVDTSQRITFQVRGQHAVDNFNLVARTIDTLDISSQTINRNTLKDCSHLIEISNMLVYEQGEPTLLIGQDNWEMLIASEVRRGNKNEPVASHTPLGWVLHGVRSTSYPSNATINRVSHAVLRCRGEESERLDEMLEQHFSLENLGVEPRRPRADPEVRALKILEETTRELPEGGYEVGLLWARDDIKVPNNYDATLKRLEGVEKRLGKNDALRTSYKNQIDRMLEAGYAEVAPSPPAEGRTWYLPHFGVTHPAKPGKLRIVHDAAAQTKGVCLNDLLLTGPDLLKSLPGVLMSFRQRRVAVAADIKDMFLRIKVRPEDRDALRFLWRERTKDKPTELRMASVLFGATSSPCTAIYVKNLNAERYKDEYPVALDSIVHHHYMDDFLQSFDSIKEANQTAHQVVAVHKRANFELQRWTSNEPVALEGLTEGAASNASVPLSDSGAEKILGLMWSPSRDTLGYNLNFNKVDRPLLTGERVPTKRELLRAAMSLYDPLGLVSPVTMQAKHILQNAWRRGVGWDEKLPVDLEKDWWEWISNLRHLAHLEIPRCYPGYADAASIELHVFVDASEMACATAVYFRSVNVSDIKVILAAAKSKVAPVKTTSIPRLELQAAVLGTRLARTVAESHDRPISKYYYWTDSQTVLNWIRAGSRIFKPFVAHRVAEIEENSQIENWRWIPSKQNIADDATRRTPPEFNIEHRWFNGPTFLLEPESEWPDNVIVNSPPSTGEERSNITIDGARSNLKLALPDIKRFSSWLKLIRATARALHFIELCRRKIVTAARKRALKNIESDPQWRAHNAPTKDYDYLKWRPPASNLDKYIQLPVPCMIHAVELWVKSSQYESFSAELKEIEDGKAPGVQSRLRQLAVQLDERGVLRLKSRVLAAADLTVAQRAPAVLDGDHMYTRLYIDRVHRLLHHGGVETVVNEVRQRYWVVRLRPTVRTVLKRCQPCRLRRAAPAEPPTGDHPAGRLAHHQRPFTYVGLDYFGPLTVTVGRQRHKRYVALFTCLTTRAVHLEVAASLTTDSAVLALRRMMARRGAPSEIWSDNGTNLRGADTELRRAALEAAATEAAVHAIPWRFIPPSAPFMGGAWERLVRSVKTALATTLHERHPSDEVLYTLLCEVEHTVNSRPLSHVSVSPEDPEALTPNHFLLGGASKVPLPGAFTEGDICGRSQWRAAQALANAFWSRWVREVLPLLQHRREPRGRGEELRVGDVVIIADSNLPRNVWPRGRVIRVFPGLDGVVRCADVETRTGVLRRPTKKLVVLPIDSIPLTT